MRSTFDTRRILEDNGSRAMSRTISLPEELLKKAEELAARENLSVEEFLSAKLSEQIALYLEAVGS